MKNKNEMRWELKLALLLLAISMVLRQFFEPTDFFMCFLLGATISFEMIALIPERTRQKLKAWKRGLFTKTEE